MSKGKKDSSSRIDQDDLLALQHEHYVREVQHSGVSTWQYDQYPRGTYGVYEDDGESLLDRHEDITEEDSQPE